MSAPVLERLNSDLSFFLVWVPFLSIIYSAIWQLNFTVQVLSFKEIDCFFVLFYYCLLLAIYLNMLLLTWYWKTFWAGTCIQGLLSQIFITAVSKYYFKFSILSSSLDLCKKQYSATLIYCNLYLNFGTDFLWLLLVYIN